MKKQSLRLLKSQKRLWFRLQNEKSWTPNSGVVYKIAGKINLPSLEFALNTLVQTHSTFQSRIYHEGNKLERIIDESIQGILEYFSLSDRSIFKNIHNIITQLLKTNFNLTQGPLFRFGLITETDELHHLVIVAHPLILSRHALIPLIREISFLYNDFVGDHKSSSRPNIVKLEKILQNEEKFLSSEVFDASLEHWSNKVKNNQFSCYLHHYTYNNNELFFEKNRISWKLSIESTKLFNNFLKKHKCSSFTLIMAIYQTLLHRYTKKNDVIINHSFPKTYQKNRQSAIGCIDSKLPFYYQFQSKQSFLVTLKEFIAMTESDIFFSSAPIALITNAIREKYDANFQGRFSNIALERNCYPYDDLKLSGLDITPSEEYIEKLPEEDLILYFDDTKNQIGFEFEYSDKFQPETVSQLSTHFNILLESILEDPNRKISELLFLSQDELDHIHYEWNYTERKIPPSASLISLFKEQVSKSPNNIAVRFNNETITFTELYKKVLQFSHFINSTYKEHYQKNIETETLIAYCLERNIDSIIILLSVIYTGAAYVPISSDYPEERINYILKDSEAKLFITSKKVLKQLNQLDEAINTLTVDSIEDSKLSVNHFLPPETGKNKLAYIIYTSGSTGQPKGVMIEEAGIIRLVKNQHYIDFKPNMKIAHASNLAFDAATFEIWGALLNGCELVIASNDELLDSRLFSKFLNKQKIETLWLTVALFNQLANKAPCMFKKLNYLLIGGDVVNARLVKSVFYCKEGHPSFILNGYGPTESTTFTTTHTLTHTSKIDTSIPIGQPLAFTQCYVLDNHLQLCPPGTAGELCIGGEGLARGYLNQGSLTEEKFITINIPLDTQGKYCKKRLYRSGDLVRQSTDGDIEFIGRIDNQIKIRGFRIEVDEIESELLSHPKINDATVVALPNKSSEKTLVAYIINENSEEPFNIESIKTYLRNQLPEYMIPSHILILDKLPITANGKIDKIALPSPFSKDTDDILQTETINRIKSCFSDLLKVAITEIKNNSGFFELGGHSLLATQLASKLKSNYNIDIKVKDIIQLQTVSSIAELIDRSKIKYTKIFKLYQCADKMRIPLSFTERRCLFLYHLDKSSTSYNLPFVFEFKGDDIDIKKLEASLKHILLSFDVFSTAYKKDEAGFYKTKMQQPQLIKNLIFKNRKQLDAFSEEKANNVFSIEKNRLYEIYFLQVKNDSTVYLFFNIHHILFDGFSLNIFMNLLESLYSNKSETKQLPSIKPGFDYFDFSLTQTKWFESGVFNKQLNYWKNKLSGELPILDLPTDRPRPANRTTDGNYIKVSLDKSTVTPLRKIAAQRKTSLFNLMLSIYTVFLTKVTRQNEVIISTPIANRNHDKFSDILGFFVNTVIYRLRTKANSRFIDLLDQIHNESLTVIDNQDVPYDLVVESLNLPHEAGIAPLSQTIFSLQTGIDMDGQWKKDNITFAIKQIPLASSKADISLILYESKDSTINGYFEYSSDLFNQDTIESFKNGFMHLVKNIIDSPLKRLGYTTLHSKSYFETIRNTVNPYEERQTLQEYFEDQVVKTPCNIAITDNKEQLTYKELNEKSNQLAHYIRKLHENKFHTKFTPDSMIGISFYKENAMIIAILACLKAGAAYVPLDPDYPSDRIQYIIEDSKLPLVITNSNVVANGLKPEIILNVDKQYELIAHQSKSNPKNINSPRDLSYIIYTSGSTGRPKGVMIEHANVPNMIKHYIKTLDSTPKKNALLFASINFDAAVLEIFVPLFSGANLHIIDDSIRKSADTLHNYLEKNRINIALIPPSLLELMERKTLPDLSSLMIGGDVCNPETIAYWQKNRSLINAYGPTECTVSVTLHVFQEKSGSHCIGKSINNIDAYVLDEQLNPIIKYGIGELYFSGAGIARGYLNLPAQTATQFISHPFSDNPTDRLYKTGDLVRLLDDNVLEFIGRSDDQIKINGFRIEIGEIEEVLNSHLNIKQCAVIIKKVHSKKTLIAFYTSKIPLDEAQLQAYLESKLPGYMVPSFIIPLPELPLTSNAKIDRKTLENINLQKKLESKFIEPINDTEKQTVDIWKSVLNLEAISTHDNFFHLGGSSITSMTMISRVNTLFETDININQFLALPKITTLAKLINNTHINISSYINEMLEKDIALTLPNLKTAISYEANPKNILLTGASGFVGVHIISELIQKDLSVYCLLRGEAKDKLQKTMKTYQLEGLINDPRIHIIQGDLSKPHLSLKQNQYNKLAEKIDFIIHNGAHVNHIQDYESMRETNVIGTKRLIELASIKKIKPISYISTLSSASKTDKHGNIVEAPPSESPPSQNGYLLTKWAGEFLIHAAHELGLPTSIIRLGNVTGHSKTGISNYHTNHTWLLTKACIKMQQAPNWDSNFEALPVDFVAKSIIGIGLNQNEGVYHLSNPKLLSWKEYIQLLNSNGYSIHFIPTKKWLKKMSSDESNPLYTLRNHYINVDEAQAPARVSTQSTEKVLSLLNLSYPSGYDPMFKVYLNYLQKEKFI